MGRGTGKRRRRAQRTAAATATAPLPARAVADGFVARAGAPPTRRARPRLGAEVELEWIDHATIVRKLYPKQGQPELESGFTIAVATDERTGKPVTLKGNFGPVAEGQLIAIKNDKSKK